MSSTIVINDTLPYTQSIATNGQTVFDTQWTVDATTDVVVYDRDPNDDPDDVTQVVSPNDYVVTQVGVEEYVRVTFLVGRTLNHIITITRQTPFDRDSLYVNTNFTPSMLNGDFGRLTLMVQQLQLLSEKITPHYNYDATIQDVIDTILPILPASHTWRKNSTDTAMEIYELPDGGIAPADMTYLTLTDESADLPNSFALSSLGAGILVNKPSTNTVLSRLLQGTSNRIEVSTQDGDSGNFIIDIVDNPIIPGTEGMGIPTGTTAERPGVPNGTNLRFNTDLGQMEYYDGGAWVQLEDSTDIATLLALLASHAVGEGASLIGLEGAGTVQDLAEVPFIIQVANAAAPNAQSLGALATGFLTSTTATGVVASRLLVATANQIDITNTDGSGNPAFAISATLNLPGTLAIQGSVAIDDIIDDDTMATATDSNIPTSESVVAYIASVIGSGAGGVPGNIQYNNAGGFGGDANFNTDGAGNIDIVGSLDVDNININGNTVSTTNVNGDLNLTPNGTGQVLVPTPTQNSSATTKLYVDTLISIAAKIFSARLASTAALTVTYNNGAAGVGATLTNAGAMAALSLDGVAAAVNDLVLIKDQASALQNGYYVVTDIGSGASNWVLTRSTLYDSPSEIEAGDVFVITAGSTLAQSSWVQTSLVTTVGVDSISFSQFSVSFPVPVTLGGTGATTAADARTNLGLGTMAVQNANAVAITGGTIVGLTNLEVDNIQIDGDSIIHIADTNNKIVFGTDTQDFQTGGSSRLDLSDTGMRLGGANARITTILDEDTMVSDSATAGVTQQSVKAYVDTYAPNAPQRNIIIGGNFDTNPWQRQVSFTNPSNGTYTADRFSIARSDDSQFNILKTADAPTLAQSSFYSSNCYHLDVTTADGTIGAAQYCAIRYQVEGYDIAFAGFGQSNAKQITLSFWHKHTVTGTYCVGFSNSGNNRSYIGEYTQAVADTWEKATITLTADTSGTWLYTNGSGLSLWFVVAAGTDWQNTANQWNATLDFASASQVNGLSDAANNFKLALVKLEAGSVATPYPFENEFEVLARCQRYYQKTYDQGTYPAALVTAGSCSATSSGTASTGSGTNAVNMTLPYAVSMRTAPSITTYNTNNGTSSQITSQASGTAISGVAGYIGYYKAQILNTAVATDTTIYTAQATMDAEF